MQTIHHTQQIYEQHADFYDLMSFFMNNMIKKYRSIFRFLRGDILEIGTGTGENLINYHPKTKITAIDWSEKMISHAKNRVRTLKLQNVKEIKRMDAEKLSIHFDHNYFDHVTSTCVFCSIPNPIRGLEEVKKILKSGGFLVQIEHGLSRFGLLNVFLKFFDPFTSHFGGQHMNRNHEKNLRDAGFKIFYSKDIDPLGIMKIIISKPIF